MSKYRKLATKEAVAERKFNEKLDEIKVTNYMGGVSYQLSPLKKLELVTTSSIFGEPNYYEDGDNKKSYLKVYTFENSLFLDEFKNKNRAQIMEDVINEALDYDFGATLEFAVKLRNEFYMRLNPQVIFILASLHKDRAKFNQENPNFMRNIGKEIMLIPGDISDQMEYYIYKTGSKSKLPVVVKRAWTDKLSTLSDYHLNKYKSKLIDVIRIADTKKLRESSKSINELMENGSLKVKESEKTWEQLRSNNIPWSEIIKTIKIPHMALLRNLRNIQQEGSLTDDLLKQLKAGVKNGKQFPFRYYTAYKQLESLGNVKILDALEECIDLAMENFPKLKGKTVCLSDNSGSAWGSLTSEYGSVTCAEISNLSSLMTAYNSEEGKVILFGDNIKEYNVSKRNGILTQLKMFDTNVGGGTETGLFVYIKELLDKKEFVDNIFIYSDQQAGHGQLYVKRDVYLGNFVYNSNYYDIVKLIKQYRKDVNPKVNVFSVQVQGYNNNLMPEFLDRTVLLGGWTGKETLFASEAIKIFNDCEK